MNTFDPTKPVQTRDGRKVRILCTDKRGHDGFDNLRIVALVTEKEGGETLDTFEANGSCYGGEQSSDDLVNLPAPHEALVTWFNERANSHLKDAVEAFYIANRKIAGIKFIRSVAASGTADGYGGLTEAKLAYETLERSFPPRGRDIPPRW